MRKRLQAAHSLGITVVGLEHDAALQRGDDAALSWDAELGREVGMDAGDYFHAAKVIKILWCMRKKPYLCTLKICIPCKATKKFPSWCSTPAAPLV